MKLVPADTSADTLGGRSIECLDLQASEPAVYKRLLAARDKLCVMLAPLSGRIEYGSLTPSAAGGDGFVVVKDPRNEAEILGQVRAAVDAASRARAALLVFPELALSPPVLAGLCEHLASGATNSYPILTVAGLCHTPLSGDQHVNEAVVVGPRGQELHRHRKLTAHVDGGGVREKTAAGLVLGVLETPCGNLATPICLDVFAVGTRALLEGSHATLLLVPSLSPKVSAHQAAAKAFGVLRWGSTFVCNRTLDGYHKGAESFYWTPRPSGKEPLAEHDGRAPCLSFSLLD
jgi:predicted amidohydrolase